MQKAFKYRIKRSVVDKLEQTLDICRKLYNAELQERRDAYKPRGKSINYVEQANPLSTIKQTREDIKGVRAQVLQDVRSKPFVQFWFG